MKNHEEFFLVALFCSCLAGWMWGGGHYEFSAFYLMLSAISIVLKYIFIIVDEREAQNK